MNNPEFTTEAALERLAGKIEKYNIAAPRYTSYPTVPEWKETASSSEVCGLIRQTSTAGEPLALYVHIPFCEQLCWYCGCNTVIKKQRSHADTYLDYLFREIDMISAAAEEKIPVAQLHWGGGTPNFLTPKQMIRLMDKLDEAFAIDYNGEIAVEADPRTIKIEQLQLLRKLGFNRISFGIQDFDAAVQEAIHRVQSFELVKSLMDESRRLEFKSINFDLIYGLPKQSVESFNKTLELTAQLAPDRIALYSFAWLPSFKASMKLIKEEELPTPHEKLKIFLESRRFFKEQGYTDIAMDHFAAAGDELTEAWKEGSLHRNFMGYTVQSCRDSIGLGLSSISFIGNKFIQNEKTLKGYYESLLNKKFPVHCSKSLDNDDLIRQWVISKLMCSLKVESESFRQKFSLSFASYFSAELASLAPYIEEGFVRISKKGIEITGDGPLFVRNICSVFDRYYRTQKGFSKVI